MLELPLRIPFGAWAVHPHVLFDLVAYTVGFRLYLAERRRRGDFLDDPRRWWVVAAAAVGAALGARLLYLLECPVETLAHFGDPRFLFGGRTIVGGLAGGWLAVEGTKRLLGVRERTGDLFAVPLAVAIAVGRIGCFLSGLEDHTYGLPTSLPWGIDLGDGVRRHPAPLYEIAFLAMLALGLLRWRRRGAESGDLFRGFVVGYFAFRLLVDFLKPAACRGLGLSAIQWACVAALVAARADMLRWLRSRRN